jgi:threonine/homoserine efflux transporter RhtA
MDYMAWWKLVLAWGCLVLFFGVPIVFFVVHMMFLNSEPSFAQHLQEFRYMGDYLRTVTAIIISLAGFNTVELFRPALRKEETK